MKNIIILLIVHSSLSAGLYDTFGVGVNTDGLLQSATFYKKYFYYGSDMLGISTKISGEESKLWDDGYLDDTNVTDGQLSINLLIPRIGLRKLAKEVSSIKTYNQIEGYIIIPIIQSSGDLKLTGSSHDEMVDALNLMGFRISHSLEYRITNQLSLVADFGLNFILSDYSSESRKENWSYIKTTKEELAVNLGFSYTKLSLHFNLNSKR